MSEVTMTRIFTSDFRGRIFFSKTNTNKHQGNERINQLCMTKTLNLKI